jgi:hypothetical protein
MRQGSMIMKLFLLDGQSVENVVSLKKELNVKRGII